MLRKDRILAQLEQGLPGAAVFVVDDSESHRGHAGYQEGGESHFNVSVRWDGFEGMSRIARHRAVHGAIGAELMGEIHALALDLSVE